MRRVWAALKAVGRWVIQPWPVWLICAWCGFFASFGALNMTGWLRWGYPALMLAMIPFILLLRRYTRRLQRGTAELMAQAAEHRTVFLAQITSRGLPIEVARRVADLVQAGRVDDAVSLALKHQPPIE